ncbi:hypothetical protein PG988_004557 [Apiospora saccharicola]
MTATAATSTVVLNNSTRGDDDASASASATNGDGDGDGAPAEAALVATPHGRQFSATKSTLVIVVLTGVSFLNTMGSGILTVSLPVMAGDLRLDDSLLLWPASVYALAAGCTLLLFGAVGTWWGPAACGSSAPRSIASSPSPWG